MKKRFVIDIEASGLGPTSYPIEVAIVDLDSDFSWSALIQPDPDWVDDEWDEIAEETVHGITREILEADGKRADMVANELWSSIADAELLSDAPEMDGFWLERLRQTTWPKLRAKTVRPVEGGPDEDAMRKHRALADANHVKATHLLYYQHQRR